MILENESLSISAFDGQTIWSDRDTSLFDVGNFLGSGAAGTVYECEHATTHQRYALKVLNPLGYKIMSPTLLRKCSVIFKGKSLADNDRNANKVSLENVWWLLNGSNRQYIAAYFSEKQNALRELSLNQCIQVWGTHPAGVSENESNDTNVQVIVTGNGARITVPSIPPKYADFVRRRSHIFREIRNMRKISFHKNVIRLEGVLELSQESKCTIFLVMELANGGELFDRIKIDCGTREHTAKHFFRQLLAGVKHCHDQGVCHRDLKPENLLLQDNAESGTTLKIADFGFSARFAMPLSEAADPGRSVLRQQQQQAVLSSISPTPTSPLSVPPAGVPATVPNMHGEASIRVLRSVVGSPFYVAPEVMQATGYDGPKADVWSLGVILYAMLAGNLPFSQELSSCKRFRHFCKWIREQNVRGTMFWSDPSIEFPQWLFPAKFSAGAKGLIVSMLHPDPASRISVSEAVQHPLCADPKPKPVEASPASLAPSPATAATTATATASDALCGAFPASAAAAPIAPFAEAQAVVDATATVTGTATAQITDESEGEGALSAHPSSAEIVCASPIPTPVAPCISSVSSTPAPYTPASSRAPTTPIATLSSTPAVANAVHECSAHQSGDGGSNNPGSSNPGPRFISGARLFPQMMLGGVRDLEERAKQQAKEGQTHRETESAVQVLGHAYLPEGADIPAAAVMTVEGAEEHKHEHEAMEEEEEEEEEDEEGNDCMDADGEIFKMEEEDCALNIPQETATRFQFPGMFSQRGEGGRGRGEITGMEHMRGTLNSGTKSSGIAAGAAAGMVSGAACGVQPLPQPQLLPLHSNPVAIPVIPASCSTPAGSGSYRNSTPTFAGMSPPLAPDLQLMSALGDLLTDSSHSHSHSQHPANGMYDGMYDGMYGMYGICGYGDEDSSSHYSNLDSPASAASECSGRSGSGGGNALERERGSVGSGGGLRGGGNGHGSSGMRLTDPSTFRSSLPLPIQRDSSSGSAHSNTLPPSFHDVVKRSTRFITAVPAHEVLYKVESILLEVQKQRASTPIGPIGKVSLDWEHFRLEVWGTEVHGPAVCALQLYLLPSDDASSCPCSPDRGCTMGSHRVGMGMGMGMGRLAASSPFTPSSPYPSYPHITTGSTGILAPFASPSSSLTTGLLGVGMGTVSQQQQSQQPQQQQQQQQQQRYLVEFVRGQIEIFAFKRFYQWVRQSLSELVKRDYAIALFDPAASPMVDSYLLQRMQQQEQEQYS